MLHDEIPVKLIQVFWGKQKYFTTIKELITFFIYQYLKRLLITSPQETIISIKPNYSL